MIKNKKYKYKIQLMQIYNTAIGKVSTKYVSLGLRSKWRTPPQGFWGAKVKIQKDKTNLEKLLQNTAF